MRTLDATDKFLPDASNKAVREFNEDARLAMVGGGIRYLQENGQDEGKGYQQFKESVNLSIEQVLDFSQPTNAVYLYSAKYSH